MNYLQLGERAEQLLSGPLDEPQRPVRLCLQRTASHHLLADADARWLVAARSRSQGDLLDARAFFRAWKSPHDGALLRRAAGPDVGELALVRLMGSLDLAPAPRIDTRQRQGLPEPVAAALARLLALEIPGRGRENAVLDGFGWGWSVEDGVRRINVEWREGGPDGWKELAAAHRHAWDLLCLPD